jgi:hypothetical protein
MRTSLAIKAVMALLVFCVFPGVGCARDATSEQALEQDLRGDWEVAKDLVFDSKGEDEPSLRKMTFETDAVVRWYYEIAGKLEEHLGTYLIQGTPNIRQMEVMVTESGIGPSLSSMRPITFVMKTVTVDFDSRFNMKTVGKVLKFDHRDGKHYVFTRK